MVSLINGAPDTIQFAKDGKYEEAWIIKLSDPKPNPADIDQYLARDEYNDLIVEYIWRSHDGANANVITIFHNNNLAAGERSEFIKKTLEIFYEYPGFEGFVKQINEKIIGFYFLFRVPLDMVRIGVLNHWFSVGPVDLWRRGEALPSMDLIKTKIAANPKLTPSVLNYQSLAFIFNLDKHLKGPYHVIKAPCSRKTNAGWEIDYDKVADYMIKWIGYFDSRK